jgi:hypothetical protein
MGLGALILIGIPVSQAMGATSKTFYSASFEWNNGTGSPSNTLRLTIVKTKRPRFKDSQLVAKITNGQRVEAICSIQGVESYMCGQTLLASSIDLSCKGTSLGALAAPATVYFKDANSESSSRNQPVLRFGTWLQGYQQAVLKTEFDQSARLMSEMKEIIRPGAEHVKLARAQ